MAGPRVWNSLPAPLRDMKAFTASGSSRRRICLVEAVAHSDCLYCVTNTVTYLLIVTVTSLTNCYHETSINKTVKLHVHIRQLYYKSKM